MIAFAAGRVSITPRFPIALAGRGGPPRVAYSAHDELEVNVVAVAENGRYVSVLVSIDALFVGRELSDLILSECGRFGVPNEAVLIVASHTHSAPALENTKPLLGERSDEHFSEISRRLVHLLADLLQSAPTGATVSRGNSKVHASVNRRRPWFLPRLTRRGLDFDRVILAPNPSGPADPNITTFMLNADRPVVIWHYACHPSGFPDDTKASADFPGVVRAAVRKRFGYDAVVLYLPGFSGDIRPVSGPAVFTAKSFIRSLLQGPKFHSMSSKDWAEWANSIAEDVVAAIERATNLSVDQPVKCAHRAALLSDLFEGADDSRLVEGQTMSLFGEKITCISAEPLHSLRDLFDPRSIAIGYSRDVFGYWPQEREVKQGGYEVHGFKELFGISGAWKSGTDEVFKSLLDHDKGRQ
jgi:hypothetical protein